VTTPTKAQVCWREYKFVGARFVGDNTNKGASDNTNNGAVIAPTMAQFQVCWREYKFVGERFVGDNTNKGASLLARIQVCW
jgi:hypothetical protein